MAALTQEELEAMSEEIVDFYFPDAPDAITTVLRRRLENYTSVGASAFTPRTTPPSILGQAGLMGLGGPWYNPPVHILDGED